MTSQKKKDSNSSALQDEGVQHNILRICYIFTNFFSFTYFNLQPNFSKFFCKTLTLNKSVLNKAENKLVVLKLICY